MDNQTYQPFTPQSAGGQPQPGTQGVNSGMNPGMGSSGMGPGMGPGGMGPGGPQPLAGMGPMPTTNLPVTAKQQKSQKNIWMLVGIIAGGLALIFLILFIVFLVKWNKAKTDVNGQISVAVTEAVNQNTMELEEQFAIREKLPYELFAGPVDYGELSFNYPKTWSVYEAKDAANGGDYEAYLNPDKVYPVSANSINALRVIIKDQPYDNYIKQYDDYVKNGKMSVAVRPINGENANIYTGLLPNTDKLQGIAAVLKVRDKTAVIQTDAMVFEGDFYTLLDSVKFNR